MIEKEIMLIIKVLKSANNELIKLEFPKNRLQLFPNVNSSKRFWENFNLWQLVDATLPAIN